MAVVVSARDRFVEPAFLEPVSIIPPAARAQIVFLEAAAAVASPAFKADAVERARARKPRISTSVSAPLSILKTILKNIFVEIVP